MPLGIDAVLGVRKPTPAPHHRHKLLLHHHRLRHPHPVLVPSLVRQSSSAHPRPTPATTATAAPASSSSTTTTSLQPSKTKPHHHHHHHHHLHRSAGQENVDSAKLHRQHIPHHHHHHRKPHIVLCEQPPPRNSHHHHHYRHPPAPSSSPATATTSSSSTATHLHVDLHCPPHTHNVTDAVKLLEARREHFADEALGMYSTTTQAMFHIGPENHPLTLELCLECVDQQTTLRITCPLFTSISSSPNSPSFAWSEVRAKESLHLSGIGSWDVGGEVPSDCEITEELIETLRLKWFTAELTQRMVELLEDRFDCDCIVGSPGSDEGGLGVDSEAVYEWMGLDC